MVNEILLICVARKDNHYFCSLSPKLPTYLSDRDNERSHTGTRSINGRIRFTEVDTLPLFTPLMKVTHLLLICSCLYSRTIPPIMYHLFVGSFTDNFTYLLWTQE